MQDGEIAGSGSYQDLIVQSADFRELIQKETDAQQVDATLDWAKGYSPSCLFLLEAVPDVLLSGVKC